MGHFRCWINTGSEFTALPPPVETGSCRQLPVAPRVEVALRRLQIPMPRYFLGQDRVFRILSEPTDELVPRRVPHQPLIATIIKPGELKELTPHPTEPLPLTAILSAEDERTARHVVLEREPPDLEHVLEARRRRID